MAIFHRVLGRDGNGDATRSYGSKDDVIGLCRAIEREVLTAHPDQPEPRAEVTEDDKICADRYRWLRSQMKVGAVRTDLPLYSALYWVGLESCTDLKHVDDAIDIERGE